MTESNWDKIKAKEQQQILFSKAVDKMLEELNVRETLDEYHKERIIEIYNILKEAHAEVFKNG